MKHQRGPALECSYNLNASRINAYSLVGANGNRTTNLNLLSSGFTGSKRTGTCTQRTTRSKAIGGYSHGVTKSVIQGCGTGYRNGYGGTYTCGGDPGKTGAYITLSCYYHFAGSLTSVPLLDAFEVGGFTVTGVGGFNDVHIVATHPTMTGLTDADLSNWSNSVHEAFDSWPISFEVLAIAEGAGTVFTAPDGTVGIPYILARGAQVISDIDLSPDAAINPIGTSHTVTATVEEDDIPIVGVNVDFEIIAGPNTGLTGSDTTDAAGQANFTYSSAVAGIDTIQATFVDGLGRTQRSDRVTKEWIGLPPIECNAGPDDSVNEATNYTLDGSGSSGGSGTLVFSWSGPYPLDDASSQTPTFTTPVVDGNLDTTWTLTLTDDAGQSESCDVIITVIDSDLPPNCDNASADLFTLWPPNHKMVSVGVTGVVDAEDPSTMLMITSITQDEPTNGLGDGDMSPDGSIDGDTARVRAERSGLGDGRVYSLGFEACDSLGQCCTGAVVTGVPHSKKSTPVDSGVSFDSTVE